MNLVTSTSGAASEKALMAFIDVAFPGDVFEYYRGFLAVDRDQGVSKLSERERAAASKVARRAALAAEAGLVHLLQRRLGPGEFSYIVVMRPRRSAAGAVVLARAA